MGKFTVEELRLAQERFDARLIQRGECLLYPSPSGSLDYGRFYVARRMMVQAHHFPFLLETGEVPHLVDHLCHNADSSCPGGGACRHRRCVRREHLASRSHRENLLASAHTLASKNSDKAGCPEGHRYDGVDSRGDRICHRCRAAATRRHLQKKVS